MKRKITTLIIILIGFLLETTLFPHLAFASIKPNLLLVITTSFGLMRGKKEGMFVGFVSGLMMDIFFGVGNMLGFYALVYTLIGYGNGFFNHLFYDEDIKLPLALISASELIYGIIMYVSIFLMRSKFDFMYYLLHVIMPELLYTLLITLALYQFILHINRRLENEEKRSVSKFV